VSVCGLKLLRFRCMLVRDSVELVVLILGRAGIVAREFSSGRWPTLALRCCGSGPVCVRWRSRESPLPFTTSAGPAPSVLSSFKLVLLFFPSLVVTALALDEEDGLLALLALSLNQCLTHCSCSLSGNCVPNPPPNLVLLFCCCWVVDAGTYVGDSKSGFTVE